MSNGHESIFSITESHPASMGYDGGVSPAFSRTTTGLTKREYFAGLAMQGMLAAGDQTIKPLGIGARAKGIDTDAALAMVAIGFADALLAELDKQP